MIIVVMMIMITTRSARARACKRAIGAMGNARTHAHTNATARALGSAYKWALFSTLRVDHASECARAWAIASSLFCQAKRARACLN